LKPLGVASLLALAACSSAPRTSTIASTWQMVGSTISVAAWSRDSAALQAAVSRFRDSTSRADSTAVRSAARRAWSTERGDLQLPVEWRDVADSYVLERALPLLQGSVDSALIDLGGLFLWVGPPTRRPVGIANPGNALDQAAQLDLQTGALSTVSGRAEGRSLTVLAPAAFAASAWASALFSLGCDRALALVQRLEGRGISLVCADSAGVRWSPDLQNRVSLPAARAP
jgi:thiamine biosynthesis lipoprotein ApbE